MSVAAAAVTAAAMLAVAVAALAALVAVHRAGNAITPRLGSLIVGMFAAALLALWVLLP